MVIGVGILVLDLQQRCYSTPASEHILSNLSEVGIKNHLVKRINMREQLVKLVDIIPIEFIVRNIATGSLTKRLGIEEGTVLERPLIEYCLKDDKLGDPIISREHILTFNWLNVMQLDWIDENLSRLNDFLMGMFCKMWIFSFI